MGEEAKLKHRGGTAEESSGDTKGAKGAGKVQWVWGDLGGREERRGTRRVKKDLGKGTWLPSNQIRAQNVLSVVFLLKVPG